MNEWLQSHRVVDSVFLFFEFSSENLEGLDVYMHVLQLLTTVDDGIQAIGKVFYREAQELLIELFCFYITTFFFIISIKYSVLLLEKTLGIYFLTWSAMNFANLMTHPSYFKNRKLC